jgi:serine/threonine-protein kinase
LPHRSGGAGLVGAGLYQKAANGVGAEEALFTSPDVIYPRDWSQDGNFIVFERAKLTDLNTSDIWILPMSDKKPRPFLETPNRETQAQISPDGKYIAYSTNATGGYQIVVRTFPDPNQGQWTITSAGGTEPRWRAKSGAELFYLSPDRKLMVVEMKRGASFAPQLPKELFTAPPLFVSALPAFCRYDVSADGQRFLFAAVTAPSAETTAARPIVTIVNWPRVLKK